MALNSSAQERIARVLLKVQVDRAELTNTTKQLDAFNKAMSDLEREKGLSRLAQDAAKAVSEGKSLRSELGKLKAELVKVGANSSEITKVVREFDRLRDSAERAANATASGTGNKLLRSIGTDIKNLPAIPIPGTSISTDVVGKIINTLGRLNIGLKELAISGGLAAAAVVAMALALKNFENTIGAIQALVTQIIRSRAELQGFLSTATPAEIVAQQKAAQDAVRETSNKIFSTLTDLNTAYENLSGQGEFGQFIARIQTQFRSGPIGDALNDLETYNQELTDQKITLEGLNSVLEENQRLLEQITFDYAAFRQQQVDRDLFNILNITLSLRDAEAETLRKRKEGLEAEKAALENVFANQLSLGISGEAITKISDRLHDLGIELNLINDALPQAERVEAAKELFERIKEGVENFVKDVAKRAEDLKKIGADIKDLRDDYKQRIIDIQNRLQNQLEDAEHDRNTALSEARRESAIAEAEAVRKAGLEKVEIERQSQINIQKILRRAKIDISNAIQDRDAVSLDAARTRKKEELTTEAEDRKERLRQLKIDLGEQLRTIRNSLKEQERTIQMRYNEQLRRAALAAQRSIAIETEKLNRELALKAQEAAQVIGIEQQKVTASVNGANAALSVVQTFWANVRNALASGSQAAQVQRPTPSNPRPPARSGQRIPTMDTGGRITRDGLAYLHSGELVINPRRGQSMGNVTFAPQINGQTRGQIKRQINSALDEFLDDFFPNG